MTDPGTDDTTTPTSFTLELGRNTYGMFAGYWPTADPGHDRLAGPINALPKLVVSETLSSAPWGEGLTFTPPTREPLVGRLGEQWRYPTGHVTTEYHLRG